MSKKELSVINSYLFYLQLYRYLARRTACKFNKIILRRLYMSRINRHPIGLKRVAEILAKREGKEGTNKRIAVVVGTVTNDDRFFDVPAMTVCALHVTRTARERIIKAGGSTITFDQLAIRAPRGQNTVLVQGPRKSREVVKHFGPPPGRPHSHAKPYVRSKGRKFEKARGRRTSRGFKK